MRQLITILLLLCLLAPSALASRDIRVDQDYDPRIELRLIVMPASMGRSLNRVDPRTVSALFATELLREYEVVDLARFENYLIDRRFDLATAFTIRAESVVRDSAQIDAVADIEIYLWDQGTGGLPLLGRQSGRLGMRIRLMDPFTGRVYWSINRVEKVSPNAEFLKTATVFFRDVVTDLGEELDEERDYRNQLDMNAGMDGTNVSGRYPSLQQTQFIQQGGRKERGFAPVGSMSKADLGMRTETIRQEDIPSTRLGEGGVLPPLFEDSYEDIERVDSDPQRKTGPVGTLPSELGRAGPPPLPASLRLDNLQSSSDSTSTQ
ncbi:hypothetical protein KQI63_15450 [bacterium]|nr:hypothetical protein [bacterium]